jgi:uncharacterized protein DUF5677
MAAEPTFVGMVVLWKRRTKRRGNAMTFDFDADGFLTNRSGEIEAAVHAAYPAPFPRALEINRDCHELLYAADIRNRDGLAIVTATLFMRALEHYQATVLLLGRGMVAPAQVALRALLETVFRSRAIVIEPTAFRTFIAEDLPQRKRLVKNALKNPRHPNLEETASAVTPELIEEIEKDIEATGAKSVTTAEWSKLAGMEDWYSTHYAMLSKAAHTAVRELDSYLRLDAAGEIQALETAPSLEEIPDLLLTAAHLILIAASAFDKVFGVKFGLKGDAHIKFIEEKIRALGPASSAPVKVVHPASSGS